MPERWDCLIVGAGPAGLSAALYMARYHRKVLVVHDGKARALRIPDTHNAPGFPDGIAGPDLIQRMTRHACEYGALMMQAEVVRAERNADGFVLGTSEGESLSGDCLILATGLCLNELPLPQDVHERAIRANVLRYCPVCDAHEHTGRRIAVIGCDRSGAAEALFLRQYTRDLTLIPMRMAELTGSQREEMATTGIRVVDRPVSRLEPQDTEFHVYVEGEASPLVFDVVYPALGCRQRTELAVMLGLPLAEDGSTDVRTPMGTSVPGLYCAGDIVEGLDQISVAMGHGAIAATRAHNWLREQRGHTLQND
ncbi:NAD(P)/FAD-dependent oxidoreductase [Lysobacter niabensis]|uniref:NAD(P)/FAD-dependent oxidoreductase n=1 Tax=Agrilutibacter niabensis TaxID=380628 RepID=UPI00360D12DD